MARLVFVRHVRSAISLFRNLAWTLEASPQATRTLSMVEHTYTEAPIPLCRHGTGSGLIRGSSRVHLEETCRYDDGSQSISNLD